MLLKSVPSREPKQLPGIILFHPSTQVVRRGGGLPDPLNPSGYPLTDVRGLPVRCVKNKAELFLDCFSDNSLTPLSVADREREAFFNQKSDSAIHGGEPNPLNSLISFAELEDSLDKISKSSAIGEDLIHNLSDNNRLSLLYMFNLFFFLPVLFQNIENWLLLFSF